LPEFAVVHGMGVQVPVVEVFPRQKNNELVTLPFAAVVVTNPTVPFRALLQAPRPVTVVAWTCTRYEAAAGASPRGDPDDPVRPHAAPRRTSQQVTPTPENRRRFMILSVSSTDAKTNEIDKA
jgi:hypothetical protein